MASFNFADLFEAFDDDPTIFADAESVITSVTKGDGGIAKVEAFVGAFATLVGHGQNAIAALTGNAAPATVATTASTGAVTTVTTSTTPPLASC